MTGPLAASNNESSIALFNKRLRYKVLVRGWNQRLNVKNIIDFNVGEKLFYGRMDYRQMSIVLRESTPLAGVAASINKLQPAMALPFVADLFNEMLLSFQKQVASNKISATDPYLSAPKAHRGFVSSQKLHKEYKEAYYKKISANLRQRKVRFLNLDEFVRVLLVESQDAIAQMPLTYTSFVKSKFNSIMSSGLAIEIASLSCSNDASKLINFISSKNWPFFVNACNQHGFMIDANCPWRIIADLGSDVVQERAAAYGYANNLVLFRDAYKIAAAHTVTSLPEEIHTLYKMSKVKSYVVTESCPTGGTVSRTYRPLSYTREAALGAFSPEGLIKLYCTLRLYEQRPEMTLKDKNLLVENVLQLFATYERLTVPITYFEKIISKTFDKMGSYSYYKRALVAQLEERFKSGQIESIEIGTGEDIAISGY